MSDEEKCSGGPSRKRVRLSVNSEARAAPLLTCHKPVWIQVPECIKIRMRLMKVEDSPATLDFNATCFSCGEAAAKKKPRRFYDAGWDWLSYAVNYKMGNESNPFACYADAFASAPASPADTQGVNVLDKLDGECADDDCNESQEHSRRQKTLRVLMCTHCFDLWKTIGRSFTCAQATLKRINLDLRPLLRRWSLRVCINQPDESYKTQAWSCAICDSVENACSLSDQEVCQKAMIAREKSAALTENASKARNPMSAAFVSAVTSMGSHAVADFCHFLSGESGAPLQDMERFLERCTVLRVCARHRNFVVRAVDYARTAAGENNAMQCIFKRIVFSEEEGSGCLCANSSPTLRELTIPTDCDSSKVLALEESVLDFTSGRLTLSDVRSQFACASCRWIISKGT